MAEQSLVGAAYGLGAAVTWGIANVMIKSQVGKMRPGPLLFLRSCAGVVAAAIAVPLLGVRSSVSLSSPFVWLAILLSVLAGYFGADFLFLRALERIPLTVASPIQSTYPLMAVTFGWLLFGEIVPLSVLIGAVTVFAGVSLISVDRPRTVTGPQAPMHFRPIGLLFAVISAAGWAASALSLRYALKQDPPVLVNAWVALVTLVCFLPLARIPETVHAAISNRRLGGAMLIAGAVGGTGLSNLLFILAIGSAGVGRASVLACTAPLFTAAFAVILLREVVNRRLVTGTLLTVLGTALVVGG
jgi:drug/metabolite transporter (DMT)-like permease